MFKILSKKEKNPKKFSNIKESLPDVNYFDFFDINTGEYLGELTKQQLVWLLFAMNKKFDYEIFSEFKLFKTELYKTMFNEINLDLKSASEQNIFTNLIYFIKDKMDNRKSTIRWYPKMEQLKKPYSVLVYNSNKEINNEDKWLAFALFIFII